MATMVEIRTALKDALKASLTDCQITDYPRSPTLPSLQVIGFGDIAYGDGGFGRIDDTWDIIVRGMVKPDTDQVRMLDRWAASTGDNSVKGAIEADQTLGGVTYSAIVQRASQMQVGQSFDGQQIYFVDFTVQVQTTDV